MTPLIIRSSRATPIAAFLSPTVLVRTLGRHGELIRQFASREVLERHKGAYLGVLWNLAHPLITLAIYTFVFGFVFGQRWPEAAGPADASAGGAGEPGAGATVAFVLPFFIGHAIFHFFGECLNRAPNAVASRTNLVRRVVFPLEILPVVNLIAAAVYPLVCVPLLLVAQIALTGRIHASAALLPLVIAPLVPLALGLSWILAAVGVYVRDVRHMIVVATQLLMFLTPVFYSVDRIPEAWRGVYMLNPLAIVIESGRAVLLWGRGPDWIGLGAVLVAGLVVMQFGYALFMRARRGFADAI